MTSQIGHNNGPDIDGQKQSIRTRWVKALLADSTAPVYVMAMVLPIHWFSRHDGTGAAISTEQFEEFCGISRATVKRGKKWLYDHGYIGLRVGKHHQKTQFILLLPRAEEGAHTEPSEGVHTEPAQKEPAHTEPPRGLSQNPLFSKDNQDRKKGGSDFWKQALNPDLGHDYQIGQDGTVILVNGVRSRWLLEFGDDPKRLDLALKQISQWIQPNSSKGLAVQVESQLARMAAERHDKDRRYAQAAKANKPAPKPFKPSRW